MFTIVFTFKIKKDDEVLMRRYENIEAALVPKIVSCLVLCQPFLSFCHVDIFPNNQRDLVINKNSKLCHVLNKRP